VTNSKRLVEESGLAGVALMMTGSALSFAGTPAAVFTGVAAAALGLGLFAAALVSALHAVPRATRPPTERLPDELNAF